MMVRLDPPASFRFSTDGLSPRERVTAIRELRERQILPIEPLADRRVHVEIAKGFLPGLAILSGTLGGVRQEGTPATGGADLFFGLSLTGTGNVAQRGRDILPGDGDAFLVDVSAGAFTLTRPTRGSFVGLRVPRQAIAPLVRDGADETLRVIPRSSDHLTLLASYVGALVNGRVLAAAETSRLVVAHVHDLIALSLGATSDASARAGERSIPAVRLRAIKSDIVA